jgi:hypothetical protein
VTTLGERGDHGGAHHGQSWAAGWWIAAVDEARWQWPLVLDRRALGRWEEMSGSEKLVALRIAVLVVTFMGSGREGRWPKRKELCFMTTFKNIKFGTLRLRDLVQKIWIQIKVLILKQSFEFQAKFKYFQETEIWIFGSQCFKSKLKSRYLKIQNKDFDIPFVIWISVKLKTDLNSNKSKECFLLALQI